MTHPRTRSHRLLLVSGVVALGALTACGSEQDGTGGDQQEAAAGSAYPVTVENCGREVTFEQAPERVLVIGGEAGTVVDAAGGAESVTTYMPLVGEPLGDSEESMADAEQLPLQTITDLSREVLIGQSPDLVVTFGLNEFTPEDLKASGIETLTLAGYCGGFGAGESEVVDPLQGVYDDVTMLGDVLGTADVAAESVAELEDRVETVREAAGSGDGGTATAVFATDPGTPLGAYGGNSMVHAQMEILGLENTFAAEEERYFEPGVESLVDAAPERMIALYEAGDTSEDDARAAVTERPELASVPAVANEDVLVLNFFYSGHGTLAVDGLERLAEQL